MKGTILFADNERGIRQFCRQELEAAGFRVVLAEDGEEAVSALDSVPVDVAILDEHMPRCGGRESACRIKRAHAHLPVILFTADAFYEGYKSPLVDATVIKSPDLTGLLTVIGELLPAAPHTETSAARRRPLGINAAFLQEIKDEHVRLQEILVVLAAWLRRGPESYHQREQFRDLLAELRDELAMHFALEEGYGYFDAALALAPELSREAGLLRSEHQSLYEEIVGLVEQAEQAGQRVGSFAQLLARVRAFVVQLHEHERREQALILQAYDDDLGVGD